MHIEPRLQWHKYVYNNNYIRIKWKNHNSAICLFFQKENTWQYWKTIRVCVFAWSFVLLIPIPCSHFFLLSASLLSSPRKKKSKQDILQSLSRNMQGPLNKWMNHSKLTMTKHKGGLKTPLNALILSSISCSIKILNLYKKNAHS